MADLVATPAFGNALPLQIGEARLEALDPGPVWAIRTRDAGAGWPAAGEVGEVAGHRAIWAGLDTVLVHADAPPDAPEGAAVAEVTDAWAAAWLSGTDAAAVLARLCPLDPAEIAPGRAARTLLGHLPALVVGAEGGWELRVPRSMAASLVHDARRAMRALAARGAAGG